MRKLGLIGGTGPESTIAYYRQVEGDVYERTGRLPPLVIESLSVYEVLGFCDRGDYTGLADYLVEGIRHLAAAGAAFASLTGVTPHVVFGELAARSPIPLVSIMDAAADEAARLGYGRVALLGTYPTMSGSFFADAFRAHGIGVVVPTEDEMRYVEDKIETELEQGQVLPETQRRLVVIADRLARTEGADAVVLGCTELPLALNGSLTSVPCLDVTQAHIARLVNLICEE